MSIDPRVALESLVSALEEHLASSASRRQEDDPAVDAAYRSIAAAFEVYEEALYDAFGEVTPLEIYEETDDDGDDDRTRDDGVDDDDDRDEDGDDREDDDGDDEDDGEDEESGYVAELIDAEVEPVREA